MSTFALTETPFIVAVTLSVPDFGVGETVTLALPLISPAGMVNVEGADKTLGVLLDRLTI
jgi:hypothetical protein